MDSAMCVLSECADLQCAPVNGPDDNCRNPGVALTNEGGIHLGTLVRGLLIFQRGRDCAERLLDLCCVNIGASVYTASRDSCIDTISQGMPDP